MPKFNSFKIVNLKYSDNGRRLMSDNLISARGEHLQVEAKNSCGKTVVIQTLMQSILPLADVGRKAIDLYTIKEPVYSMIEWILDDTKPKYSFDFQKLIAWDKCTEVKTIVSKAIKNVKSTPYGKGKKKIDLQNAISRYAAKTDSETMAEAFADVYINGKDANPLSVEIKKLTIEKLKKYKGVL